MRYMKLKFHDFIPIKSIVSTLVMALVVYKGFFMVIILFVL